MVQADERWSRESVKAFIGVKEEKPSEKGGRKTELNGIGNDTGG